MINLPRTDYYKDTEAIEQIKDDLADAEADLDTAKQAYQDFVDGYTDDAFDVAVEEGYLLDMQEAYDEWLKAKSNYQPTIDNAVNSIKEREIPDE